MERRGFSDEKNRNRKGKGKEEEHPNTTSLVLPTESDSSNTKDSGVSTMSRLASSAASLMGEPMTTHSRVPNILPSSKAGSSGTTQSSGTAFQETARLTHVGSPNVQSPLGSTVRSTPGQGRGNSAEDNFSAFLGIAQDTSSSELGENGPSQKLAPRHLTHAATAAMNDGSEVVDLLETAPTLDEDGDEDGLYMTNKALLSLRKALFEEGLSTGTSWDDVLNFVPEFLSNHSMGDGEEYQQLARHLGVSNVAEARDIWVGQWEAVLSSYTDEVWGDLGPLVMAARQELQSIPTNPEGTTTSSLNAVRRLQQLLAHVRGTSLIKTGNP
ncbi:hypothetical protein F4825DRAFT_410625 [Nemania diffusa]|nr:hypothetical protein F4825DRAFT_410625 [Nemania diffusa]